MEKSHCFRGSYHLQSNSTEHISWEVNTYTGIKEIPHHLWNPGVHYQVHTSLPLDPIQTQMNTIYIIPPCFFKIHFNIILPYMSGCSNVVSSLWLFELKCCTHFSVSPMHATCLGNILLLIYDNCLQFLLDTDLQCERHEPCTGTTPERRRLLMVAPTLDGWSLDPSAVVKCWTSFSFSQHSTARLQAINIVWSNLKPVLT
jgi:hypothetical protein